MEGEELEALKALAESIKQRMEQAGQLPLDFLHNPKKQEKGIIMNGKI